MPKMVKIKAGPAQPSAFWQLYFMTSIAFIGATLAFGLASPFFLISRIFSPLNSLKRVGDSILGFAVRLLMRVQPWLRAQVHVESTRALGRGCLLVANHRSHLDAFLLLAHVPGIRIFARRSLFRIPFLGAMMWLSRQIPAGSRNPADLVLAMKDIQLRLRDGDAVLVFPEMTRCQPGALVPRKFLQSPFGVAFRENVPVIPVVIQGTDLAWPKGSWKITPGFQITVRSLGILEPRDFASEEALAERARFVITEALKAGSPVMRITPVENPVSEPVAVS